MDPLKKLCLDTRHTPTGFTRHSRAGTELPFPTELRIVQYPNDSGYYLFYCDEYGVEMTDTFHETIASAEEQAFAEYGVARVDWTTIE